MATFRGVYEAHKLTPAPAGILSVARVMEHTKREYDERWIRGFSQEYDTLPTYVRLLTVNDSTVTDGTVSESTGSTYEDYVPFFIDVEDFGSTFSLLGEDRFKRVIDELKAVTQKAVEYEFWEGVAARAETTANGNMYLSKQNLATIPAPGAFKPETSLMILEQAISESPVGEGGIIHMTRDVASILGSRLIYLKAKDETPAQVMTRLGTPVVIGSGYTGAGPIGEANAAASTTNKWIYATGGVDVHLGKIEVVNETLAQGADVTINDMRIKAFRPAAVLSDPSMHFAMRVTLPNE
jgi:hypothetical protein